MAASVTLDTNILVYALDSSAASKRDTAASLVARLAPERPPLALQTLSELSNSVLKKRLLPPVTIQSVIDTYLQNFTIIPSTPDDIREALQAVSTHHLAFWDAMLWATARRVGCRILFTEDFQDGRTLHGLTFRNPFKLSAAELKRLLA